MLALLNRIKPQVFDAEHKKTDVGSQESAASDVRLCSTHEVIEGCLAVLMLNTLEIW